jgi:dTDP-4-amino-4,6-dideoxygalactose transaminase
MLHLAAAGISARRGIMAAHRQPAHGHCTHVPLPVTERLNDGTLILPLFHQMTDAEHARVCEALATAWRP